MGTQYKTVGGSGTGLGQDFSSFLQQGLNTGSFGGGTAGARSAGANPMQDTMGIAGILNNILSSGAGSLGGSLGQLISQQQTNDVNNLRARFGVGGGTAFGTPRQYAESNYRAQAAPQIATQVGQLQMGLLGQLLPLYGGLAGKDIPQAETAAQENPWLTAAKLGLQGASAAAGFFAPTGITAPLAGLGQMSGPGSPGFMGQMPQFQVPNSLSMNGGFASGGGWQPNWNGYVPTFNFGGSR